MYREIEDPSGVSSALNNLGLVARHRGDYDQAEEYFHESLDLNRKIGDAAGIATTLNNLGNVALAESDYDRSC